MIGGGRPRVRSTWLAVSSLGGRRAWALLQRGTEELIDRIDEGDEGGLVRTLARLHDALHHNRGGQADGPGVSGASDPAGSAASNAAGASASGET